MTIRILLADNHVSMRESLHELIDRQTDMEVEVAENGRTMLELFGSFKPDVLVLDINMKDLKGIEAVRRMISDSPSSKIIALSIYSDSEFVNEALKAGAHGYLLKDCAFEELARAIRTVVKNQAYMGSGLAGFPAIESS